MNLTLKIEGKDKKFKTPFISARFLDKTLRLIESGKLEIDDSNALFETIIYITEAFGDQFTPDQFYEGLASKDVLPTLTNLVAEIMGKTQEATAGLQDPNE